VTPLWRFEKSPETGREVLSAHIAQLSFELLSDIIASRAAHFLKIDGRSRYYSPIDPPKSVILSLLEASDWKFASLNGIVTSPTMRPDGSLLTDEGYDEATGLWYKPSRDINLPTIPIKPDRDQALTALSLLNELLHGFPFEDECSRSAALAAILTIVLRGAFVPTPLFLITAPEARTGKTYLSQLISVIGTGHKLVPTSAGKTEEEFEKRVETAALSGRPIISLNNIRNGLIVESEVLAQLSTEGRISIRKLGRHQEGDCDCRASTVILNGNNIQVAGDLVVRTVECRINARKDEPEQREFDFDPINLALNDRAKYLSACFTIARAYNAGGNPRVEFHGIAGFESWSQRVQRPLIWLGCADPFGRMRSMRATDPTLQDLRQLLDTLRKYESDLGGRFTVADCKRLAEETQASFHSVAYCRPDLHQLMVEHGDRGQINTKRFGHFITKHVDRKIGGWSIQRIGEVHNAAAYRLDGPSDPLMTREF
jgi:putative DNA primase/helicase